MFFSTLSHQMRLPRQGTDPQPRSMHCPDLCQQHAGNPSLCPGSQAKAYLKEEDKRPLLGFLAGSCFPSSKTVCRKSTLMKQTLAAHHSVGVASCLSLRDPRWVGALRNPITLGLQLELNFTTVLQEPKGH